MHILKTSLRSTGLKGWESSRMFGFHRQLKCIQERSQAATDWEGRREEEDYQKARPAQPPFTGARTEALRGMGRAHGHPAAELPRRRH